MLSEVRNVQQLPGEPPRRWFFSHEQDLWVWLNESGELVGFQLAYGKYRNEHAIRWNQGRGFGHYKVDDGEEGPVGKGIPILTADGGFNAKRILDQFLEIACDIPQDIVAFVAARIREHPGYRKDT